MNPTWKSSGDEACLYLGSALDVLPTLSDESVNCCVTSPPYWGLRDYGIAGQLGLESTPEDYVASMVAVFREVRRVLKDDGTLWLNIGDTYNHDSKWGGSSSNKNELKQGYARKKSGDRDSGCKPKDLVGIPWALAFALRSDGWWLRQDIIWHKPNPMPESVTDRCTKAHEYIFLLSKTALYYFDSEAMQEPASKGAAGSKFNTGKTGEHQLGRSSAKPRTKAGLMGVADTPWETRNRRSVWTVATAPYEGAHFATFPPALIEPCILAGCPEGGTVLDPFNGSGTTGQVALKNWRRYVGIDINPEYVNELSIRRIESVTKAHPLFPLDIV